MKTLENLFVSIDPRTLIDLPACYSPSMLALEAALAALVQLGIQETSAYWLARRTKLKEAVLGSALKRAKLVKTTVDGRTVIVGKAKRSVLKHDLYRKVLVCQIAAAPSSAHVRAWLLCELAAASKSKGHRIWLSVDQARRAIGRGDPIEFAAECSDWVQEHMPHHHVTMIEDDDGLFVEARLREAEPGVFDPVLHRIPYLGSKIRTYWIHDGTVHGHALTVRPMLAAKAVSWARNTYRIGAEPSDYRVLWLAAVSAWERGRDTGVECWPAQAFEFYLGSENASTAFVEFVLAVSRASDRGRDNQALRWTVADPKQMEHERITRLQAAKGLRGARVVGRSTDGAALTESAWRRIVAQHVSHMQDHGYSRFEISGALARQRDDLGYGRVSGQDTRPSAVVPNTVDVIARHQQPERHHFYKVRADLHVAAVPAVVAQAIESGDVPRSAADQVERAVIAISKALARAPRALFDEFVRMEALKTAVIRSMAESLISRALPVAEQEALSLAWERGQEAENLERLELPYLLTCLVAASWEAAQEPSRITGGLAA